MLICSKAVYNLCYVSYSFYSNSRSGILIYTRTDLSLVNTDA